MMVDVWSFVYNFFFGPSSMLDYMGHPVLSDWHAYFYRFYLAYALEGQTVPQPLPENYYDVFSNISFNWLPFRAAYLCWYWNYRDQLLETGAMDPEDDSFSSDQVTPEQVVLCTLLRYRCWYKDSFTTALTNTGSGNFIVPTDVLKEYDTDRLISYYNGETLVDTVDAQEAYESGATIARISVGGVQYSVPMNYLESTLSAASGNSEPFEYVSTHGLSLELFDRVARLRRFTRKELILGYEYDDVLWSSFRVRLSNYRMRVPELLDRGRDAVAINTIVNNTTTAEQVAGDKTAVAWAQGRTDGVKYFVEEHGYYFHFMSIMPIPTYVGGMSRLYLKRERFDMMWPEFATMGMDAVYNFELAAPLGAGAENLPEGLSDQSALAVFGYQGRYYDLKSEHDEAHGRFRTDLNYMLFDRRFNELNPPQLNYIFVHCHPRLDMFVTDDPSVDVIRTIDVHSKLDCFRTLPVESERV